MADIILDIGRMKERIDTNNDDSFARQDLLKFYDELRLQLLGQKQDFDKSDKAFQDIDQAIAIVDGLELGRTDTTPFMLITYLNQRVNLQEEGTFSEQEKMFFESILTTLNAYNADYVVVTNRTNDELTFLQENGQYTNDVSLGVEGTLRSKKSSRKDIVYGTHNIVYKDADGKRIDYETYKNQPDAKLIHELNNLIQHYDDINFPGWYQEYIDTTTAHPAGTFASFDAREKAWREYRVTKKDDQSSLYFFQGKKFDAREINRLAKLSALYQYTQQEPISGVASYMGQVFDRLVGSAAGYMINEEERIQNAHVKNTYLDSAQEKYATGDISSDTLLRFLLGDVDRSGVLTTPDVTKMAIDAKTKRGRRKQTKAQRKDHADLPKTSLYSEGELGSGMVESAYAQMSLNTILSPEQRQLRLVNNLVSLIHADTRIMSQLPQLPQSFSTVKDFMDFILQPANRLIIDRVREYAQFNGYHFATLLASGVEGQVLAEKKQFDEENNFREQVEKDANLLREPAMQASIDTAFKGVYDTLAVQRQQAFTRLDAINKLQPTSADEKWNIDQERAALLSKYDGLEQSLKSLDLQTEAEKKQWFFDRFRAIASLSNDVQGGGGVFTASKQINRPVVKDIFQAASIHVGGVVEQFDGKTISTPFIHMQLRGRVDPSETTSLLYGIGGGGYLQMVGKTVTSGVSGTASVAPTFRVNKQQMESIHRVPKQFVGPFVSYSLLKGLGKNKFVGMEKKLGIGVMRNKDDLAGLEAGDVQFATNVSAVMDQWVKKYAIVGKDGAVTMKSGTYFSLIDIKKILKDPANEVMFGKDQAAKDVVANMLYTACLSYQTPDGAKLFCTNGGLRKRIVRDLALHRYNLLAEQLPNVTLDGLSRGLDLNVSSRKNMSKSLATQLTKFSTYIPSPDVTIHQSGRFLAERTSQQESSRDELLPGTLESRDAPLGISLMRINASCGAIDENKKPIEGRALSRQTVQVDGKPLDVVAIPRGFLGLKNMRVSLSPELMDTDGKIPYDARTDSFLVPWTVTSTLNTIQEAGQQYMSLTIGDTGAYNTKPLVIQDYNNPNKQQPEGEQIAVYEFAQRHQNLESNKQCIQDNVASILEGLNLQGTDLPFDLGENNSNIVLIVDESTQKIVNIKVKLLPNIRYNTPSSKTYSPENIGAGTVEKNGNDTYFILPTSGKFRMEQSQENDSWIFFFDKQPKDRRFGVSYNSVESFAGDTQVQTVDPKHGHINPEAIVFFGTDDATRLLISMRYIENDPQVNKTAYYTAIEKNDYSTALSIALNGMQKSNLDRKLATGLTTQVFSTGFNSSDVSTYTSEDEDIVAYLEKMYEKLSRVDRTADKHLGIEGSKQKVRTFVADIKKQYGAGKVDKILNDLAAQNVAVGTSGEDYLVSLIDQVVDSKGNIVLGRNTGDLFDATKKKNIESAFRLIDNKVEGFGHYNAGLRGKFPDMNPLYRLFHLLSPVGDIMRARRDFENTCLLAEPLYKSNPDAGQDMVRLRDELILQANTLNLNVLDLNVAQDDTRRTETAVGKEGMIWGLAERGEAPHIHEKYVPNSEKIAAIAVPIVGEFESVHKQYYFENKYEQAKDDVMQEMILLDAAGVDLRDYVTYASGKVVDITKDKYLQLCLHGENTLPAKDGGDPWQYKKDLVLTITTHCLNPRFEEVTSLARSETTPYEVDLTIPPVLIHCTSEPVVGKTHVKSSAVVNRNTRTARKSGLLFIKPQVEEQGSTEGENSTEVTAGQLHTDESGNQYVTINGIQHDVITGTDGSMFYRDPASSSYIPFNITAQSILNQSTAAQGGGGSRNIDAQIHRAQRGDDISRLKKKRKK